MSIKIWLKSVRDTDFNRIELSLTNFKQRANKSFKGVSCTLTRVK